MDGQSIGERIEAAVKPIVPICVPRLYGGVATEYCTYNYTETPDSFGDDTAEVLRCSVQVHWVFPWSPGISETDAVKAKKKALRRVLGAVMTSPAVTNAGDDEWEHYVFEGEMLEEA